MERNKRDIKSLSNTLRIINTSITDNNVGIHDPSEIANAFNNHFAKVL